MSDIIRVHEQLDVNLISSRISPFDSVQNIANYTVSFIPKGNVKVIRDTINFFRTEDIGVKDSYYFGNPDWIKFKKPKVSVPRIIMYTHNRDCYLKLTLNSLMNSLYYCPEVPVTLIGNKPTPEVLSILTDFQNRYPQIEVLLCEENVAFAAQTIGIMWYKPENVIMAEDDFILPQATKYLYPIWPYQFAQKLDHCQFLGFGALFNNLAFNILSDWTEIVPKTNLGWYYWERGSGETKPILMCQLSCFKSKLWKQGYNQGLRGVLDNHFNDNAQRIAIPFLKLYHTGFNQFQDNVYSYTNFEKAKSQKDSTRVTSLRTNESRVIVFDDVKNLEL